MERPVYLFLTLYHNGNVFLCVLLRINDLKAILYVYSFISILLDSSVVSTTAYKFEMNFDVVLKNIRELNILAGEGCSEVSRTKDGARLKVHAQYNTLFQNNVHIRS